MPQIFGPVQQLLKFNTIDEVIQRANNSNYGLAAAVHTSNIDTANTVVQALRAGTVWSVNHCVLKCSLKYTFNSIIIYVFPKSNGTFFLILVDHIFFRFFVNTYITHHQSHLEVSWSEFVFKSCLYNHKNIKCENMINTLFNNMCTIVGDANE